MKGFIFLGLCVSPLCIAQKTDSLKVKEIEILNFTKKLPVTKEIIYVEKDYLKIKHLFYLHLIQEMALVIPIFAFVV